MNWRAWQRLDWWLLLGVAALILLGAAMIESATLGTPDLRGYAQRHLLYAGVGGVVLLFIAAFDYRLLPAFQWPAYLAALVLLLTVDVAGVARGGAQRWLDLGIIEVQPAELVKGLLLISLGHYLAERQKQLHHLGTVLVYLGLLIPPLLLIYLQPDLGTAVSVFFLGIGILFVGGIAWRYVLGMAIAGLVGFPFIWLSLEEYMRQRVLLFLNPAADPQATYNVRQALIAIGSGGLVGKGYKLGTQSQLHFLRVRHTDFIFPVIAEELGFLGATLVIALFLLVLYRLVYIALSARDMYGRLLASGVALIVFFQAFVNIGMNVGLLPVTGIPLPFVSYGGTNLVTMLMLIGLAQSVYAYRRPSG